MRPSYDPSSTTQETLPNVVGEHAEGQLELHEPGPRAELEGEPPPPEDPRQCWLRGVPGVRVGAQWRRDSAEDEHVPWTQLTMRMHGIAKRTGRQWSDRDRDTMRQVELQCWGVVELGDRNVVIPAWMRASSIDTPNGELELGRRGKALKMPQRTMLALVWTAFEHGTGGVYMSRNQWCEVLGVTLRTVDAYREQLEAAGLIRIVKTHAMASFGKLGPRRGSQDHRNLYRIGPALDCVALAAFERKHVRYPRGAGITRHAAGELAAVLRSSARERGRQYQHAYHERRATSVVRSVERTTASSARGAWGAAPAAARSAAVPPTPMCAGPAENAILPASPLRGGLGGTAALRAAAGAAPQDPRADDAVVRSTLRVGSTAPRPSSDAPPAAREHALAELAAWRPPTTPEPRSSNPSRRRATGYEPAPRKRTWQDAAAELGRTLEATGNRDAAESVIEALASIGVPVELERPPRDRAAFALELLERERLRDSLHGASLFGQAPPGSPSSSSAAGLPSSSSAEQARCSADSAASDAPSSSSSSSTIRTRT